RKTGQQLAFWNMRHSGNFAMAFDQDMQRVLTVFRTLAKLAALATDTGAVIGEAEACGDVDDLFLDAKRQRIYVTCGQGFLDVVDAKNIAGARVARVRTVSGARTSLFVPELDRLFVAARAQTGSPAAIHVYRPGP